MIVFTELPDRRFNRENVKVQTRLVDGAVELNCRDYYRTIVLVCQEGNLELVWEGACILSTIVVIVDEVWVEG